MSRAVRAVLVALALLLAAPALASALTVNQVAREVRCPTCNTPLDVSNAPIAVRMKAYIAERIDRGWDKQRIIDGLVDEFGEGVLTTPPKKGFDLIAWIVPGLLVAAGLIAIPIVTRAWARRPRAEGPAPREPTDDEARALDVELRRHGHGDV
ncbi:MAG: cytochrome c-type biosis protein CcmH [Miltoncostaeaceae bacterium]|nr:cytochrome c-type biosis protein CcmH [Miltoncostaeaceae bacterium]